MNVEILIKDVTQPKLTLTPHRMTIKFSETFKDKDRIVEFSNKIMNHIYSNLTQSVRGRFMLMDDGNYEIDLKIKKLGGGNELMYSLREGAI